MDDLRYEPLGDGPLDDVCRILSLSFGMKPEQAATWIASRPRGSFRRMTRGNATVGTVMQIPMGAFYGGRRIGLTGIAGVGVAPEARGRGIARRLMREVVRDLYEQGSPLSGLYSAMHPLYRGVGYEIAGSRCEVRLPLHLIPDTGVRPDAEAGTDADMPEVHDLARRYAAYFPGHLDRTEYIWGRILNPRGLERKASVFLFRDGSGTLEAYAIVTQVRPETNVHAQDLVISDMASITVAGWRRILALLRGFSSVVGEGQFFSGTVHPIFPLLEDRRFKITLNEFPMLRILRVGDALAQRGYSAVLRGEVTLRVEDEALPQNAGGWRIRWRDGNAEVEPCAGDSASARLHVRDLAPLYSGFLSATQLAMLGRIEASAETLAMLDAAFLGRPPSTPDFY